MLEREVFWGEGASAMGSDTKHSPRGMLNHPGRPGKLYCGLVALCYMALAVALLFFNKAALSSYKFPNANVITLAQLACSNVLLYAFRKLGWVRFTDDVALIPRDCIDAKSGFPTQKMFRRVAPLSAAYMVYMLLSMASVRGVSLPMYTTLRRTTAAFTMGAEYFLAGTSQPAVVVRAVGLMVLGAFVAGLHDLEFSVTGYAYVFANNAATAAYLACIARYGRTSGLNSFGMMWCNGMMSLPALTTMTLLTGELQSLHNYGHLYDPDFQSVLMASCVLAFSLNYAIFLNTSLNSALTQTICGNLKDVVVILVGYHTFGGVAFDPLNFLGILLGFAGSVSYAYVKLVR